ncbi:hypothetical protein [Xylophilus sp. GOD-11R]|uniref:hypothetical protein n=1 Tax=Xylophilus sp. GOD-11R TaxID=3089814 RepID=UPI00298C5B6A|nr:hypothetical protein [Xylophilus sp. GOD-11R]WPB56078.1 hypothetical protein R9X41_18310 [Xylophilus sp. GOD-11R]
MPDKTWIRFGSLAAATVVLTACACAGGGTYFGASSGGLGFFGGGGAGLPQGDIGNATPATVQARLGTPTASFPLPEGGQRLQYSQMPAGYQVWNYDFDTSGRLIRQDQALRYDNFNRIVQGQTREDEILRTYGRPMRIVKVATFDGPIWDYRFSDINNPRIISIHIDRAGIVQRIVYNDIDRRRLFSPD